MADAERARTQITDSQAQTRHLPIEVEVSGLAGCVTVAASADPGAVRGAVEKALRDVGLALRPR